MKNKQLLNERMLGLAGIRPMTSIGFSTNAPISEELLQAYQQLGSQVNESDERLEDLDGDTLTKMIIATQEEMVDSPSPGLQDRLEDLGGAYDMVTDGDASSEFGFQYGRMNEVGGYNDSGNPEAE